MNKNVGNVAGQMLKRMVLYEEFSDTNVMLVNRVFKTRNAKENGVRNSGMDLLKSTEPMLHLHENMNYR